MRYKCQICGYVYDDSEQKMPFDSLPDDWCCPLCGAPKSMFKPEQEDLGKIERNQGENKIDVEVKEIEKNDKIENYKQLSFGALSSVCSNLAKGCEKQYLFDEAEKFKKLSNYFSSVSCDDENNYEELISLINKNIEEDYKRVTDIATKVGDRGALRAKVWGEKVTMILSSLLKKYDIEGENLLKDSEVFVCSICGFIYVGKNPPELCPVCKVQSNKFIRIEEEL